jgi:hypothetical protein
MMKKGQVMVEFTFCMIILFLMMYGLVMVFRWAGLDLSQREAAHEALLAGPIFEDYVAPSTGPLRQIDPYFYQPAKMNGVWAGD